MARDRRDRQAAPGGGPARDVAATTCANCGAVLAGPYCARCGQKARDRVVSVRRILLDTLEDQLAWDATLPLTMKALLLRPGELTREYLAGRVVRYIPPMRLYLAASLLFFLTLSFVVSPDRMAGAAGGSPGVALDIGPAHGIAAAPAAGTTSPASAPPPASDELHGGIHIRTDEGPQWLRHRLTLVQARLNAMDRRAAIRALFTAFWDTAPKVAFLLLPVFALILKGLYLRRRRLYVEHFVFALHVETVAFLAFTLMLLLRNPWVNLALALGVSAYCYQAMRRVYGQGWFRTLVKLGILGWSYTMLLAMGVALGALFAVLTL